ncbi:histidine phosphatase family protein [Cohnella thailandensis]|uniref:Histidine phosphatase family protein n=1 Tax=Cohnella thailandensis TaxID=557557 RepID=A0A841SSK7_9BACL|nr:histidine phosphatase family protein [Cohnella thailandensis]MBB6632607.1 histidine phosphatase family protein [Cohnella thailandensis]MBP1975706.1 2,3-bisphosphoglycerate-dependent phosphoglycerate mutase [Cohnella thailandensis]
MEKRTTVYLVRHAESPYVEGQERSRGLSGKGAEDALKVGSLLRNENIDIFVSSPYERAIQTIKDAAGEKEILLFEDLRERSIGIIPDRLFREAKFKVYQDFDFAFPEGESSLAAQQRAIQSFLGILRNYEGQKIAIGTHGDIMTLILNFFDKSYRYDFWKSTSMPDVNKLEFENSKLVTVVRLWEE